MDKMQEEVKKKNVGETGADYLLSEIDGRDRLEFWAVVVGTDYNLSLQNPE